MSTITPAPHATHPVPAAAPSRPRCRWCGFDRVHRWGRFSGRQRYRCQGCRRTFSTFTGTPLRYLKRIDCWLPFCDAMKNCLSVRQAATATGLHKDTVFRWRHRLLRSMLQSEVVRLEGRIAVGFTWLPRSYKGRTSPDRPPRRQRFYGRPDDGSRNWVVLARDETGHGYGRVAASWRPGVNFLTQMFDGRVAPDGILIGDRGRYSPLAICAIRLELGYQPEGLTDFGRAAAPLSPGHWESPGRYVRRFRLWLRRFHGVATRYLDHYLFWFRALHGTPLHCLAPSNPRTGA